MIIFELLVWNKYGGTIPLNMCYCLHYVPVYSTPILLKIRGAKDYLHVTLLSMLKVSFI